MLSNNIQHYIYFHLDKINKIPHTYYYGTRKINKKINTNNIVIVIETMYMGTGKYKVIIINIYHSSLDYF